MYCELDLEVIAKITAYPVTKVTLSDSIMPLQNIIKHSDFTIANDATPMEITFDFPSASYSSPSATSVAGTKEKNTLQWTATPRLHTLYNINQQVKSLQIGTYTFLVETLTGFQYLLPSTIYTYKFEHEQDSTGSFKCKVTIENLERALMILD